MIPCAAVAARITVTVLAGADPFGEPRPVDPDEVRDAACDATARSEVCSPEVPDLLEPVDPPDISGSGGGAIAQLLVILLVAALIAALAWLLYQFVAGRSVRADVDDDGDVDETEDLDDDGPRIIDEERPPDRWRRRAAEHRSRGEYRDVIRCEYRALVGDLARAGFVDEIPGRTSGEERAQIRDIARPGSPVPERFDTAADLFDRAWFDTATDTGVGGAPPEIGAADDERFVVASQAVLGELLARTAARSGR